MPAIMNPGPSVPDDAPIVIITGGEDAYTLIRTKAETIDELDRFFSSGEGIRTLTGTLEAGGKVALLTEDKDGLLVILIYNGRDVTQQLLNEAFERHQRMHKN